MVRLHLGCGDKRFRGYVNVDSVGEPDVKCDITALPFPAGCAEEIIAVHVFEHLFPWKALDILKHWHGILKPGGKLILEMPDLRRVLEYLKDPEAPLAYTMYALYGGEQTGRLEDVHKWCWTFDTLKPALEAAGFRNVVEGRAHYHVQKRDFRIEGTK